jgi:hypothetical protein
VNSTVQDYERIAQEQDDRELSKHLFDYYPTLNDTQRRKPDYRKWRRCLIVEALRRGMITKDPGLGPPERS